MKVQTSTSLDEKELKRVEAIAAQLSSSSSSVIRNCVIRMLPELELQHFGITAIKRKKSKRSVAA